MKRLMKSDPGEDCLFSTMFDFYGFPEDMLHDPLTGDHAQDVCLIEEGMRRDVERFFPGCRSRFVPMLLLHEFETFVFVEPQALDWEFIEQGDQDKIDRLKSELLKCGSPEAVNSGEETAPSKRILRQFKEYSKVHQGTSVVGRIGVDKLLSSCPHFKSRIDALIAMARPE